MSIIVNIRICNSNSKLKRHHYRPKSSLGNGEPRSKQELRHLGHEPLRILSPIILQHVLRNRRVADDHEVAGPGGQPVDGPTLLHPLEQREEEGPTEEVGDVVELGAGGGDAGAVVGGGERAGEVC